MPRNTNGVTKATPLKGVKTGAKVQEELWPEEKKPAKGKMDEFQRMEQEVILEMEKEKKKKDPAKKKKKKKTEEEKENTSIKKSTFESKEVLYEKHVGPRVRSFDAAKMKNKFNKPKDSTQVSSECRICGKQVFQMEKIVAEKASWHKNCFRCKECNKNLNLESYQSHEGALYCKPHFKELFRPKVVVQDEDQERKERQLRRPRMIVLESNPEELPDDVVRATAKPDYGLEELQQTLNVKKRFEIFENFSKEEEKPTTEPISVRRSQSLMSKAAKFLSGDDANINGVDDEVYEEEEEDSDLENGQTNPDDPNQIVKSSKKKERPMSFSGMGDLKAAWEQKQRREEMSQSRKEEVAKFRQLLCAGKNISLKEKFESGIFDEENENEMGAHREEIKIEGKRAVSNLWKRFEQGQPFIMEDEDGEEGELKMNGNTNGVTRTFGTERQEVNEIFKEAETAKKARNVFKQIDSKVAQEGNVVMRNPSFASLNKENRLSLDASMLTAQSQSNSAEIIKSSDKKDDFHVDTTDLANRFKFFMNYETDQEKEMEKKRKVFRITPPREGIDQVEDVAFDKTISSLPKPCMAVNCTACKFRRPEGCDELEILGRDPNLIKSTDNYQDEIDCRNTKNILQMFKKMEMGEDEEEKDGPRPLKCFTPPLDAGEHDDGSEYSVDDYSDEDEEEGTSLLRPELRDEILQMLSAKKAAGLRAKFERWESEMGSNGDLNDDREKEGEECMPSLDTAKNLKAIFEHKANEIVKPISSKPAEKKINRFV